MEIFRNAIPVKIQNYLNGRILLQDTVYAFQCIIIGLTPIQNATLQIINRRVMVNPVALLRQKFCQIISHFHNGPPLRAGILKGLLRMGMVNKDLRPFPFFI